VTKHQPATPLPWQSLEDGRSHVKLVHVETTSDNTAGAGLPVCSINRARIGDAEYLTHAANAYPKLVEALRDTLEDRSQHLNRDQVDAILSLLRELGEEG
jgi:hypothetical protein